MPSKYEAPRSYVLEVGDLVRGNDSGRYMEVVSGPRDNSKRSIDAVIISDPGRTGRGHIGQTIINQGSDYFTLVARSGEWERLNTIKGYQLTESNPSTEGTKNMKNPNPTRKPVKTGKITPANLITRKDRPDPYLVTYSGRKPIERPNIETMGSTRGEVLYPLHETSIYIAIGKENGLQRFYRLSACDKTFGDRTILGRDDVCGINENFSLWGVPSNIVKQSTFVADGYRWTVIDRQNDVIYAARLYDDTKGGPLPSCETRLFFEGEIEVELPPYSPVLDDMVSYQDEGSYKVLVDRTDATGHVLVSDESDEFHLFHVKDLKRVPRTGLRAIKFVSGDGTTRNNFKWPLVSPWWETPAEVGDESDIDETNTGGCPSGEGDGLCIALNYHAAETGGHSRSDSIGLYVEYDEVDVLGDSNDGKLRVRKCRVVGTFVPNRVKDWEKGWKNQTQEAGND